VGSERGSRRRRGRCLRTRRGWSAGRGWRGELEALRVEEHPNAGVWFKDGRLLAARSLANKVCGCLVAQWGTARRGTMARCCGEEAVFVLQHLLFLLCGFELCGEVGA
jgi:hypothetical protein